MAIVGVPFIDLTRFEHSFIEKWVDKAASLCRGAAFLGGEEVELLEQKLSLLAGTKCSISCANGTDAMQLALRALGVGEGDKVLLPNFTFWATFESIVNVGAIPVTVDCELIDGGMSFKYFIEAAETYKPKAAILVHLFGWSTRNIKQIRAYAKEKDILLLEDGAQCFGANFNHEPIYKHALISTTSFYPSKVLGAAGDGGAVFTNDHALAVRVRRLANHGRQDRYLHDDVGWNSRLGSLQAAYLNLAIDHLPGRIRSRIKTFNAYLGSVDDGVIAQMMPPPEFVTNGYCNVSLVGNPDLKIHLEKLLKEKKIGFGNIYPTTISNQKGARRRLLSHVGPNEAYQICKSVVNLPLFPYMTENEITQVINTVKEAVQTLPKDS